eukprot:1468135-Amphidinium_carterae.1
MRRLVHEAKRSSWQSLCTNLSLHQQDNGTSPFRLLKAMEGKPTSGRVPLQLPSGLRTSTPLARVNELSKHFAK